MKRGKKIKKNSCFQIETINGITRDPQGICDRFSEYYLEIYTPLESQLFDNSFKSCIEEELNNITNDNENYDDIPKLTPNITSEYVEKIVRSLKSKKASSFDNFYHENLKLKALFGVLSIVFIKIITE